MLLRLLQIKKSKGYVRYQDKNNNCPYYYYYFFEAAVGHDTKL